MGILNFCKNTWTFVIFYYHDFTVILLKNIKRKGELYNKVLYLNRWQFMCKIVTDVLRCSSFDFMICNIINLKKKYFLQKYYLKLIIFYKINNAFCVTFYNFIKILIFCNYFIKVINFGIFKTLLQIEPPFVKYFKISNRKNCVS